MTEARRVCPSCGTDYGGDALFCPRDGAPLASRRPQAGGDPYLGLVVEGKLHLERLVGIGVMGRVYRAHQAGTERPVAVKILHREHVKNPTLVARFQREGRVAGSLQHPGIVTVLWAGELPREKERTDGEPYVVMDYLDGLSLRSAMVAAGGSLPVERALRIVIQICDAMGEAHAHGVVHRDLKPENVMLIRCAEDPDFVKVLDFGVARVGEADSSIATHAGAILGTATYACPESARGDAVGPPGDVYAIATVLFECLSGKPPFQGKSAVDVLIQHAQAAPPSLRTLPSSEHVPAPIAHSIEKNLAKNPAERAGTARELGQELLRAARESGIDPWRLASRTTLLGVDGMARTTTTGAATDSKGLTTERIPLRTAPTVGERLP